MVFVCVGDRSGFAGKHHNPPKQTAAETKNVSRVFFLNCADVGKTTSQLESLKVLLPNFDYFVPIDPKDFGILRSDSTFSMSSVLCVQV